MKVIAQTVTGYLVEMSEQEVARAAGFSSVHDSAWLTHNRTRHPVVGSELEVNAAHNFHAAITRSHQEAKKCAGFIRGLADMLEHGLDDVIRLPEVKPDAET